MDITNDYNRLSTSAAGADATGATSTSVSSSSPTYQKIRNQAAVLLGNPAVRAGEKAKIMALLAQGETAAASGSTGLLRDISVELSKIEPASASNKDSSAEKSTKKQAPLNPEDDVKISYQDQSGDADVSLKSAVEMNQYLATVAVPGHEREHAVLAQARALMNNEDVTSYVSIHTGYDGKGRLIITGGTTTVVTHAKTETPEPATSEQNKVDTTV